MDNELDSDIIRVIIKDMLISLLQSHRGDFNVEKRKEDSIESYLQKEKSLNLFFQLSQMKQKDRVDVFRYVDDLSERISSEFMNIVEKKNKIGKILSKSEFRNILLESIENIGIKPGEFNKWTWKISPKAKSILVISNPEIPARENYDIVLKLNYNGKNKIRYNTKNQKDPENTKKFKEFRHFKKYFQQIHFDIATIAAALFKIELMTKERGIMPTNLKLICGSSQIKKGATTLSQISSFLLDYRIDWDISVTPSNIRPKSFDNPVQAVCLFSGGLDSLAGFLDTKKKWNDTIGLYVYHGSPVSKFTMETANLLEDATILQVNVQPSGGFLQQTRGLLYMLSGAIYTDILKSETLVVSECGATMYQPPLTPSDEITKTVHPRLIEYVEKFFNEVFDREIRVTIPFRYHTKAEVIASLVKGKNKFFKTDKKASDIIHETFSCRHTKFAHKDGHCGYCYGCLLRHLALELVTDISEEYFLDPLEHDLRHFRIREGKKPREIRLDTRKMENIIRLVDLSIELFKETDKWPEHVLTYFNQLNEDPEQIYNLYRRLAKDILFGLWRINEKGKLRNSILLKKLAEIEKSGLFSGEDVIRRRDEILRH